MAIADSITFDLWQAQTAANALQLAADTYADWSRDADHPVRLQAQFKRQSDAALALVRQIRQTTGVEG